MPDCSSSRSAGCTRSIQAAGVSPSLSTPESVVQALESQSRSVARSQSHTVSPAAWAAEA